MRRIVTISVIVLVLSFSAFISVPAQRVTMTIWVDKGCGGEYFAGEMLTVNWRVSHASEITFWEIEPDGLKRKLGFPVISPAGEGSRGWTIKEEYGYGRRAIQARADSIWGIAEAECEFYVVKKAADIEVKVKDQDGEPISGVDIVLDGNLAASTDTMGVCTIPEVEFGEHTITAAFDGEEQSSHIQIASTQKQYVDFVFTVEKRGSINVRVYDQHADPISGADVYVDGFKEGRTSQDGEFTIPVSEGSHFVEVEWQNEKAEKSVTVVRNQTSFVDLTIYFEVETIISVSVTDEKGNAISDATVYLDNMFLGRTDAGGRVAEEKTTPGPHTVRVEKKGYESGTQNITITEGENSITVALAEEKASAGSLLVILGFLYILKRRRR
jgi:hypothetical protein